MPTDRISHRRHFTRRELCGTLLATGLLGAASRSTFAQLVTGASKVKPGPALLPSKLEIASSNAKLVEVFDWARTQAMAYTFDQNDPVGPWYEAVEPGREAFCIRDTCHQALGAHMLGLARCNLNMLRRFAEHISDSKDWCSYWEIGRFNRPAPVDYKDDAEFWYNLPSNFDLVDCCYRMYVWTGDPAYVEDPGLLNLYDRTVNDYVERWGLDIDHIMTRPRLLNVRGIFDTKKKFPKNRGIPGYNESDHTYVLGFDVLASQRAAYLAYAHIQQVRQNAALAATFLAKAAAVEKLLRETWWNQTDQCFYARLNKDYQLEGRSGRGAGGAQTLDWNAEGISGTGGFPRADDPNAVVSRLLDLSHARLEYPEISFTRVGDIISDIMGVNLQFTSPLLSSVEGNWVEVTVKTLSGLGNTIGWAEVRNLPIRACEVSVRHEGNRRTTFTNQRGPALIWRAIFDGRHDSLLVNGQPVKAAVETDDHGRSLSSVRVTVGAGGTVRVETDKG
ncbi:hypothetical protein [Terriglobus albidus]|uniref:hypothetical protein n=1 Tax=Terriglobus albidus TaxID=1592106 RepID=UPI0021DF844A|nr:hypothetical protein [Terriglobus albidus]